MVRIPIPLPRRPRHYLLPVLLALTGVAAPTAATRVAQASGLARIETDQPAYQRGDPIRICFSVPGPGSFTITDYGADGTSHVVRSGTESGSGGPCLRASILPTAVTGRDCLTLDYTTTRGGGSLQTCFQVVDAAPPLPPAAAQPALTVTPTAGPAGARLAIDGVGFQEWSDAAHGLTLSVFDGTNTIVDSDDFWPVADGSFHVVLHTAGYAPGTYTLYASYTFWGVRRDPVTGLIVCDFCPTNTVPLADPVTFTITEP